MRGQEITTVTSGQGTDVNFILPQHGRFDQNQVAARGIHHGCNIRGSYARGRQRAAGCHCCECKYPDQEK